VKLSLWLSCTSGSDRKGYFMRKWSSTFYNPLMHFNINPVAVANSINRSKKVLSLKGGQPLQRPTL
jgi:hypothetical protein